MKTDSYILPNGLRVILVDTEAFPTFTANLFIGAGSRYETKENNGVAHFFEHMAFKGTKKYPSANAISTLIDGIGGEHNAFTAKDHTGYWIKATNEHLGLAIDLLSEMIMNPRLLSEEIEKEKGSISEEINMYEDMPTWKVSEVFEEILYKGNPLSYTIAGKKEVIHTFVRNTLQNYMDEYYRPSNAILVVAGGIGDCYDSLKRAIETAFGLWKELSKALAPFKQVESVAARTTTIIKKPTEQAHFCFGFPAYSNTDERRFALSILTTILGGGASSRLYSELREKRGLCYYVSTGKQSFSDCGNVVTSVGVANNIEKVKEAIDLVWKEHEKISTDLVSDEELSRAKALIKGRLLLGLEDSEEVAEFYGRQALLQDSVKSPEELVNLIDSVSRAQVREVAADLFKEEKLHISLIGPFEEGSLGV